MKLYRGAEYVVLVKYDWFLNHSISERVEVFCKRHSLTFLDLHGKHIHLLHPFLQLVLCRRRHRIHIIVPPVVLLIRECVVQLKPQKQLSITANNTQLFIHFHNLSECLCVLLRWDPFLIHWSAFRYCKNTGYINERNQNIKAVISFSTVLPKKGFLSATVLAQWKQLLSATEKITYCTRTIIFWEIYPFFIVSHVWQNQWIYMQWIYMMNWCCVTVSIETV